MQSNMSDDRINLSAKQFHQSCQILFGEDIHVTPQFLSCLQPSDVKKAYHKLARETHPDRAQHLGADEAILEKRFKNVNCAYEQVSSYIEEPDRFILTIPPPKSTHRPYQSAAKSPSPQGSLFYKGEIPSRRLIIGQFLYYSGIISMRQMWDAVVWQRFRRPFLGEIACKLGWLTPFDIKYIIDHCNKEELFGKCALRTGLLNSYQVLVLLGRQKNLQPRIGIYFIERGILTPQKLDAMETDLKEHNRKYWFKE